MKMAKKELNKKSVTESVAFKKWFDASKVVDENNQPLIVFHGTTHKFFEFTKERGNVENHFGLGYYFTDSRLDVESNYLSFGVDLTKRIEMLAENLSGGESPTEKNKKKAKKLLKGKHEIVMSFYLKMLNPINITFDKKSSTKYDAIETEDEDGNYIENEDSLPMKLYNAIRSVSYDYDIDFQGLFNDISEKIGEWDYIMAYDVDKAFRESEYLGSVYDNDGNFAGYEFIRRVYEHMGFDGIVMDGYNEFGGGRKYGKPMEMEEGTKHYIAFNSSQIKLADEKNTTFDGNNSDIRFEKGGEINNFEYTIGGL